MNTDLYTPLAIFVPAIIVIISWWYNAKKTRELEEFKIRFSERIKVRIEMLKSLITFKERIETKKYKWDLELNTLLRTAYVNFQLYGEAEEQIKMKSFITFLEEKIGNNSLSEEEREKYTKLLIDLVELTIKSLRKELAINS
jgi:hypothetical protein